jgi:hypothetical protein
MQAVLEINSKFRLLRGESPGSWIVQEVDSVPLSGGGTIQRYFTRTMPLQAAGIVTWLKSSSLPGEAVAQIETLL